MTIDPKSVEKRGRVWVRSSALLPVILPSSPPATITMESLAMLRAQIQGTGEGWEVDKTRFFLIDIRLSFKSRQFYLPGGQC